MKKTLLVISVFIIGLIIMSFSISASINYADDIKTEKYWGEFNEGFKDGWCDGYKDREACGSLALCPLAPLPPLPEIGQSSSSYKDGYTEGFKAGFRQGMRDCN